MGILRDICGEVWEYEVVLVMWMRLDTDERLGLDSDMRNGMACRTKIPLCVELLGFTR